MDIINKREGPRREDVEAKRHINRHWGTIEKLADQFSGGTYSANKVTKKPPQASGLIISDLGAGKSVADQPRPYLRITLNGRVALLDLNTGLQMHVLGQISRKAGKTVFLLATKENGFVTPLAPTLLKQLAKLEGMILDDDFTEDDLSQKLKDLLELT